MPTKRTEARADGSHAWDATWSVYDEEQGRWVEKTQTFDTEAEAEAHEKGFRDKAKKRKREDLEQLTPEMRRAINLERSGGTHATEARASEKIQELLLACDEEGFEVRPRSARGQRADMLMRFKDIYSKR